MERGNARVESSQENNAMTATRAQTRTTRCVSLNKISPVPLSIKPPSNVLLKTKLILNPLRPGGLTLSLPESNLESINLAVTFKSFEILVCDHSNGGYRAVLPYACGAVCFWQLCKMKFKIFFLSFKLSTLGSERVNRGFMVIILLSHYCGILSLLLKGSKSYL